MAWIKTTSEQDATGELKEVYGTIRKSLPMVPNVMQSLSLKPAVLAAVARVFTTGTFGGSNLSRVQEETIATVVSALNQCHY
jgi:hypothetical protein